MAGIVGSKSAIASGGTVTTAGAYTVHAFTTTGANTFTPAATGFIDVLLVGGGGGGSSDGASTAGGGAGATLFKKMIPVTASTPYPVFIGPGGPVGGTGTPTTFTYSGITTTAAGGGAGAGTPSPNSSAGGGASGGSRLTGAGIYGIGYPGGISAGGGNFAGGGGAGGAGGDSGPAGPRLGGPGVPITYFTGISGDTVSVGGPSSAGSTSPFYGSGGAVTQGFPPTPSGLAARPGVVYIRYI